MEQIEQFEATSPASARELEATLTRSHAVVYLVSERSLSSGVCSVEAFSGLMSVGRPLGKARAFVIKEQAHVGTPDFMWNLQTAVYKPGFEVTFAKRLALLFQSNPSTRLG
jgi:hypothetical protein